MRLKHLSLLLHKIIHENRVKYMKRRDLYTFFAIFLVSMLFIPPSMPSMIPNAFTQDVIPDWIKNNAGWWADDKISEAEFINAIHLHPIVMNHPYLFLVSVLVKDQ